MHQSNTTIGVFIVCLKTFFRHKRYLHLLFFFFFFPLYILINRLFLLFDYFFIPEIKNTIVSNPLFIMGFNRSGTTFFHKFLSKSNNFTTSKTSDMVFPSIVLRKLLRPFIYLFSKLKFDIIEEKNKGHEVRLDQVEEDELLLFLHQLDSKWITNNLAPWMMYEYKDFSRNIGIDSVNNIKRNKNSFSFYKNFWKRQMYLQNNKLILSKANPFVFKIDSLLNAFPDGKFIFIVRDPLETITSYFSMQEKIKYGNIMTKNELQLYREEAYQEIIDWYKATEDAQHKLNPSHFIVLTYNDLIDDLEGSIERCFRLSNQTISDQFREMINQKVAQSYVKKHQNKTAIDFGFSKEKIRKDFDFIYQKYFNKI
tara:strand:- start:638 stop:1741 length:1104 start_codon:yes stop_codon:yes gene_type:complete